MTVASVQISSKRGGTRSCLHVLRADRQISRGLMASY
jgi:hypothetical protein